MTTVLMVVFAILTVLTASGVVLARKPLTSALWLVATLFLVAVHFVFLSAEFIAVIQILVYAGAIMVLVIFVIMLLGLDELAQPQFGLSGVSAVFFSSAFLGVLVFGVRQSKNLFVAGKDAVEDMAGFGSTEGVGEVLFTQYLYLFEVASVLLLAAIIGAVVLVLEEKRPLPAGRGLKAKRGGQ